MNWIKKISNIWKLGEYEVPEPGKEASSYGKGTETITALIKKPQQKGTFIAFNRRDPIQELVNEKPE
jgi:hypothetical protein